jgi:hypothetical protein
MNMTYTLLRILVRRSLLLWKRRVQEQSALWEPKSQIVRNSWPLMGTNNTLTFSKEPDEPSPHADILLT